jgi:hypothetical protein
MSLISLNRLVTELCAVPPLIPLGHCVRHETSIGPAVAGKAVSMSIERTEHPVARGQPRLRRQLPWIQPPREPSRRKRRRTTTFMSSGNTSGHPRSEITTIEEIDSRHLRRSVGQFVTGVTVVTYGLRGRPRGVTVNRWSPVRAPSEHPNGSVNGGDSRATIKLPAGRTLSGCPARISSGSTSAPGASWSAPATLALKT